MKAVEGEVGTWSHCGSRKPHGPHTHTIVMNEGPYYDVPCHGTPKSEDQKNPTDEMIAYAASELERLHAAGLIFWKSDFPLNKRHGRTHAHSGETECGIAYRTKLVSLHDGQNYDGWAPCSKLMNHEGKCGYADNTAY